MQRRAAAAGKDVAVDEVGGIQVALIVMIRHGDGLDQGGAVRFQPVGTGAEIGRQVAVADRFDHLDRNQPVELPGQVTVVLLQQGDLIVQPAGRDFFRRQVVLLL